MKIKIVCLILYFIKKHVCCPRHRPSTSLRARDIERSRDALRVRLHVVERSRNEMKGFMYILLCANGNYYTGSTIDLERRLQQHQLGEGANFTRKHLPVKLMYFEEFERIDEAFYREKQVQGWSRAKKEALIKGERNKLHELSECKNETASRLRSKTMPFDSAQGPEGETAE